MLDAPYIRFAEHFGACEDETSYAGECAYCKKLLLRNPEWEEDEWIDTNEKGLVCRSCFGRRYFDDIKEKKYDYI